VPDVVDVPALLAMPGPELVFGLIGAVGTDLAAVSQMLAQQLRRVSYTSHEIRVSKLLHSLDRYGELASPSSGAFMSVARIIRSLQPEQRLSKK
jgi:hypothetical protein